jgi:hypothetical protein
MNLIAVMTSVTIAQRYLANAKTHCESPVYGRIGYALNVDTKTKAKRSGIVSSQYQITYKVEGVRVLEVTLPEGVEPPNGFDMWSYEEQDLWLFERQISSKVKFEDIHFAEPENVLQVRHLEVVR